MFRASLQSPRSTALLEGMRGRFWNAYGRTLSISQEEGMS